MKKLFIGDIVSRAWDLAVKHWPVFLIIALITGASGALMNGDPYAFTTLGDNPDPAELYEALFQSYNPIAVVVVLLLNVYLSLITYRMLANVMDFGSPYREGGLMDILKVDLAKFGLFLGVEIVYCMAVSVGSTLCLIPGLFIAVRWCFAPLIAATGDITFSEALGRSWELTKGHFWELFLLGLTAIGIAIVGFCACCVGVFFAEIIVNFMIVIAYYALKNDDTETAYVQ